MINVLNDIHKENNYIEPEPNTHTKHNTEHNTNTASTSNEPLEAAGPTKDDMEGLFKMVNEELFPGCTFWQSLRTSRSCINGLIFHLTKLWKENQCILGTQARQFFYLEDPSRSHHWKVVQYVNHRKICNKDEIVDADVVHDSNSSDVALIARLDDLEYTQLSGAGPSTKVSFIPTSLVNDDEFIDDDDEYNVVHVLSSDSEDEDSH
ncbi:hypothetical protein Tco_0178445 [Tanacetum coccineum]